MTSIKQKSLIGTFVLGSIGLLIVAVVFFGSGLFFTPKTPVVLYFQESVGGLSVGSPVVFRGVQLGQVTGIKIEARINPLSFSIPVTIELAHNQIQLMNPKKKGTSLASELNMSKEAFFKELIDKGLRAELYSKSFVTGELQVMLDFAPDTPETYYAHDPNILEIPTKPSKLEKIARTLESLPLSEITDHLLSAVKGIDELVNSEKMKAVPEDLSTMLTNADAVVQKVKTDIGPLIAQVEKTFASYKALADDVGKNLPALTESYTKLAQNADEQIRTMAIEAKAAMLKLESALDQGQKTLVDLRKTAGPNSATVTDLQKTLNEIAGMARSAKSLFDFLERHPEALIQGKGQRR
ncbi:MlaD family protein [Desulfovibrio inopinatus]|uniref:MlaD family protein n=1 Tax=Desulfovibrio inopinatus TaxID=102109 RepID=UPI000423F47F|nr:MlaD family protein [Desulfovibrio inopinatus]